MPALASLLGLLVACTRATALPPHTHDDTDAHAADTGDTGGALPPYTGPSLLSETGLLTPEGAVAADVIAYGVRFPLWSDGADKERFLWLPPGGTIDVSDPGAWRFPAGTKAWKTFRVGGVALETRLVTKLDDGWEAVSYVWREDGTDADVAPDGVVNARGTAHDVPDREGCIACHRGSVDGLLGVGALQLAGDPALATLTPRLSGPLPENLEPPGEGVTRDALTWLHAQCGSCHNDVHPFASRTALRLALPLGLTDPDAAPARVSAAGVEARHAMDGATVVLVPGQPDASQLVVRAAQRGRQGMPPLGSEVVDEAGLASVRAWIAGMAP